MRHDLPIRDLASLGALDVRRTGIPGSVRQSRVEGSDTRVTGRATGTGPGSGPRAGVRVIMSMEVGSFGWVVAGFGWVV